MTEQQKVTLLAVRKALDVLVTKIADSTAEINENLAAIRPWHPGAYAAGDVRMHGGIPYRCVQAHDSTANPGWTPEATPALWAQYHGTTPDTARPWIAPTGAHDMYNAGEYVLWTNGACYQCVQDTAYSPADYSAAWKQVA